MNTVEKRKKTMKERHGIECPLVSPGVREKTLARIKEAASKMLPTGESLSAFCDRNNFKRRWGRIILEKYGMAALINFVTLQQKKITSCEIKFIELMKEFGDLEVLHRNPKELLTTRKADFCLDINKKRLFVITENLWDGNQGRGIFSNIRQSFEKTNNAVMMFYSNEVFDRPKVVKS